MDLLSAVISKKMENVNNEVMDCETCNIEMEFLGFDCWLKTKVCDPTVVVGE